MSDRQFYAVYILYSVLYNWSELSPLQSIPRKPLSYCLTFAHEHATVAKRGPDYCLFGLTLHLEVLHVYFT